MPQPLALLGPGVCLLGVAVLQICLSAPRLALIHSHSKVGAKIQLKFPLEDSRKIYRDCLGLVSLAIEAAVDWAVPCIIDFKVAAWGVCV